MGRLGELSYADLAQRYGVDLCTGECDEGGHEDGWYGGKRVHFRERGVTRSGLRKFLMLVHDATVWGGRNMLVGRRISRAQWIHHRNRFATDTAFHDLGIRIPRSLSAADRAQVRHLLIGAERSSVVQRLHNWARAG